MGYVERVEGVFWLYVETVDVVEIAIPGFGYHGERPPIAFHVGVALLHFPGDHGVADHAYAVGVGDHDGAVEKAGVFEPCGAGHFSVAVEGEPAPEDRVVGGLAAGMNGGDSGADGAFANFEFAAAGDERGVADFDSLDVGDGVVWAGRAVEGDSEIAGSGIGLSRAKNGGREECAIQQEDKGRGEREGSKSHHRFS